MVSPTGKELEQLYNRLNGIVPLRGATTPEELLKRFHRIMNRRPRRAGNMQRLIDHDLVTNMLRHYYRGRRLGPVARHTSRFIYQKMRPKEVM